MTESFFDLDNEYPKVEHSKNNPINKLSIIIEFVVLFLYNYHS
jgi:hypothetical protein